MTYREKVKEEEERLKTKWRKERSSDMATLVGTPGMIIVIALILLIAG